MLADGIWPRGMSKDKAALDEWCKAVAPSKELRQWFDHDPDKWTQFSKDYTKELKDRQDEARALVTRAKRKPLILLTGTKDMEHSHLLVLKKYLSGLKESRS